MNANLISILYAVGAAIVSFMMAYITNCRWRSSYLSNETEVKAEQGLGETKSLRAVPYWFCPIHVVLWIGAIVISALCGYVLAEHTVSALAVLELGICYMAILGAAVIDWKLRVIPNYFLGVLILLRGGIFIYEFLCVESPFAYLLSSLLGCFLCALFLIIANRISKGGIGRGDIKLLSGVGLMAGIYIVFTVLLLALLCCIAVTAIPVLLKKKSIKTHLPFGPFIYMGFVLMCLLTLY